MSKYEEAIMWLINPPTSEYKNATELEEATKQHYIIVEEIIRKAQRYDSELANQLTVSAQLLRENKELKSERDDYKAMAEDYRDIINNQDKDIKILIDGIKALNIRMIDDTVVSGDNDWLCCPTDEKYEKVKAMIEEVNK